MAKPKPQRLRDPVHNLIPFGSDQFENTLWQVIQTPPFQRLRRIRQLGFSEFVFPGATHTRFAHSIGVFHMARQLLEVIRRYIDSHAHMYRPQQAQHALAAALLHDVGHGMFSHSFEAVGKHFGWSMAHHESVSQILIRDSEISETLDRSLGNGFSSNVADIIAHSIPVDLYGSIVSSQFDADRLDYMQRDRLMTGIQSSGVDPTWLLANLEVAEVSTGADETATGKVETLVLGPKAMQTAESYVLALFHLYPNVYLHKATRGAEMLFKAFIRRLYELHRDGNVDKTGLPKGHPFFRFLDDPAAPTGAMGLDDSTLWGALPLVLDQPDAPDPELVRLARCLHRRELPKCFDVRERVEETLERKPGERRDQRQARVKLVCDAVAVELNAREASLRSGEKPSPARFLVDQYTRDPYKRFQESKTPLNQILIRMGEHPPRDMADFSPIVANAERFVVCRAYFYRDDVDASGVIENILRTKNREVSDAGT